MIIKIIRSTIRTLPSKNPPPRSKLQRQIHHNASPAVVVTGSSPNATATTNNEDPSTLVTNLLTYTRELMQGHSHHVVAFSGGVDSSLVLKLLMDASSSTDRVQAILGISNAVSQEQIHQAHSVAAHIGADLVTVETKEGADDVYLANAGQACLACKTHLYSSLQAVMDHVDDDANDHHGVLLYNGTNSDDTQDPTRLGLIAARNFSVQSPLLYSTKQQVRMAAKYLGLPNHQTAASPCLRSRLALGVHATASHLNMIEQAERRVKLDLQLAETVNFRVRMLTNRRARVEVDEPYVQQAEGWIQEWGSFFHQELGFTSVSVKAFQSGSVAVPI